VAAKPKAVEQAADELYELPPGEFTRARDERAKALRKDGHRDEADAVKALRKPTVAAWALNQLAHRRPKEVERLVAAGDELRAAQEELLAGGDRKAFQSAAATERDQVAKLAAEARTLVAGAGESASPALQEKIAETLHAAALDEETAAELRAGRLVREREAIGGFGGMTAAAPPRSRGATTKSSRPAKTRAPGAAGQDAREAAGDGPQPGKAPDDAKRGKASADRKRGKASADAKRRKAEADEAAQRQRLAAARTDERHARRELDAATKAIQQAETRAEAARTHADEANRRAATTEERLKEARRAQTAARKVHARAERALEAADRAARGT
jgi:hypothetical protein